MTDNEWYHYDWQRVVSLRLATGGNDTIFRTERCFGSNAGLNLRPPFRHTTGRWNTYSSPQSHGSGKVSRLLNTTEVE